MSIFDNIAKNEQFHFDKIAKVLEIHLLTSRVTSSSTTKLTAMACKVRPAGHYYQTQKLFDRYIQLLLACHFSAIRLFHVNFLCRCLQFSVTYVTCQQMYSYNETVTTSTEVKLQTITTLNWISNKFLTIKHAYYLADTSHLFKCIKKVALTIIYSGCP